MIPFVLPLINIPSPIQFLIALSAIKDVKNAQTGQPALFAKITTSITFSMGSAIYTVPLEPT